MGVANSICTIRTELNIHRSGPNTVSESTVLDTELSEFFCPHQVARRELGELLSAYYLCAKADSLSFPGELTEFAAELSEFSLLKQYSRNSIPGVSHRVIDSGTVGNPCEPNLRIENVAICTLRFAFEP